MTEEKCCGSCCWFFGEQTDGNGFCIQSPLDDNLVECNMYCKTSFCSRDDMRHHMAVLLQANRYRRDQHVPAIYKMPKPKELGEAIDFAYKYMKVFSKL